MKKLLLTSAIFASFAAPVFAAEPADEHTLTANITVASDYRFRGISQTFKQPTLQGGFDYVHSSGFYLGNWNSTISGLQLTDTAGIEMDFYGGYKFAPIKDVTADIGVLYYYYPGARIVGARFNEKYNNAEMYFGASYQWFSAKYSYNFTNFFGLSNAVGGNGSSKGSSYLDLNANFDVADKTTLGFHVGKQWISNYGQLNYTDYKLSLSRAFDFGTLSAAVIGTDTKKGAYAKVVSASGKSKDVTDTTLVLAFTKSF